VNLPGSPAPRLPQAYRRPQPTFVGTHFTRGDVMSIGDKAKDAVQKVAGKAEEAVGKKTDDAELTHQGQKDQAMSDARLETEKAKDATDH